MVGVCVWVSGCAPTHATHTIRMTQTDKWPFWNECCVDVDVDAIESLVLTNYATFYCRFTYTKSLQWLRTDIKGRAPPTPSSSACSPTKPDIEINMKASSRSIDSNSLVNVLCAFNNVHIRMLQPRASQAKPSQASPVHTQFIRLWSIPALRVVFYQKSGRNLFMTH